MINAEFFSTGGKLIGFSIRGHAGYSDGDDIVCASVSSAVQFACNLITECFGNEANVTAAGDTINLLIKNTGDTENAVKVIDALRLHLSLIADDYDGTIKITFSEV